jgi:hypothetical protein
MRKIHKMVGVKDKGELEEIVRNYLLSFSEPLHRLAEGVSSRGWKNTDTKRIIHNLTALSAHEPSPKLVDIIDFVVTQQGRGTEGMQISGTKTLTTKLLRLEELKDNYGEGVEWAYDILLSWRDDMIQPESGYILPYFIEDVIETQDGVLTAVTAPAEVRDFLSEINEGFRVSPLLLRHSQFGEIAREMSTFYRTCVIEKGNYEVFEIGTQFRAKALLGSYPELLTGLANLPSNAPPRLVSILRRSINEIEEEDREIIGNPLTESLVKLLDTFKKTYQKVDEDEVALFTEAFEVKKDQPIISTVQALTKQLSLYSSEKGGRLVEDINRTTEMINRFERKAAIYFMDRYQMLETKLGLSVAGHFKETYSLFRNIRAGRRIEFMDLYSRFLLGRASKQEERLLGPILRSIATYSARKRDNESALHEILAKGPSQITPHVRKKIKEASGKDISSYWDLRPLQQNLYSSYEAFLNYQSLVDERFDEESYLRTLHHLIKSDQLSKEILIIGGGCGMAKKEVFLVRQLRRKGFDTELILIDKNQHVGDLALVHTVKEGLYYPPDLPPILELDLERLALSDLSPYEDLLQRQVLFTLFGGTPFNIPNIWGIYSQIRKVLVTKDAKPNISMREKVTQKLKELLNVEHEAGYPNLVLTEGDSTKDLAYYYRPASVEFLNQGIAEEYQITREDSEGPIFIVDEKDKRMKSFYLLNQNHRFNKQGQTSAVLVIDSGTLNEKNFDQWMAGVGFRNEFLAYNGTVIAISKVAKPVRPFEERVRYFSKSFE